MLQNVMDIMKTVLNDKLAELEKHFNSDCISFYGSILDGNERIFTQIIEDLVKAPDKRDTLYFILTTGGGSATAVERQVNIIRHHYKEVHFIVPDYAYSAGTIYCMSGDSILMDYSSVLGPIDPQIATADGKMIPVLGYLDKVDELIGKAKNNTLTQAEFLILKDLDLAELRKHEQAKELTIDLLKKWLVKYKFKNWDEHRSNPSLIGQEVTEDQKVNRAEEIADKLSDNKRWKSHGRPINIETLEKELRLEIDDYSMIDDRRDLIRSYYNLLIDYIQKNNYITFLHTRRFI